jgi:periodic tryptophan protein 1
MRKLPSSSLLSKTTTATPAKFTLAAHEGAASSLDVSPHVRGCLATGGTDKMVKLWNINENEDTTGKREVSLVTSRDLGVVRSTTLLAYLVSLLGDELG